ncbi:MAG: sigma-70 family RNA polymerase sigma factor [Planctomycetaceae bacterium]
MPEIAQFQDLIRRVRDRDEDAARELTVRYEKAIRRVVRIHLRDPRMRRVMDSMDVCQSVLTSFFVRTALGEYELDTPDQLINLLTTITRNKVVNQVQRHQTQRRDIRRTIGLPMDSQGIVDRSPNPADDVSAKEILEKVRSQLDADERYLAEQRSEGKTWPELAEELNATPAALRKKLSRALDRAMVALGLDSDEQDDV